MISHYPGITVAAKVEIKHTHTHMLKKSRPGQPRIGRRGRFTYYAASLGRPPTAFRFPENSCPSVTIMERPCGYNEISVCRQGCRPCSLSFPGPKRVRNCKEQNNHPLSQFRFSRFYPQLYDRASC